MVKKELFKGKEIYECEICEFGYEEKNLAEACESFCKTHKGCSLEITGKAVKKVV